MTKTVAIIGAGAAGCFAAAEILRRCGDADVHIFESGRKPLSKVAVTGGGRCNYTNTFEGVKSVQEVYPRGARLMKRLLKPYGKDYVIRWFAERGVPPAVPDDGGCIFPRSQKASDIVGALLRGCRSAKMHLGCKAGKIRSVEDGFTIETPDGLFRASYVLVTTGGSPSPEGISFLGPLHIATVPPVPSLYTFEILDKDLRALTGIVVEASLRIPGTTLRSSGPLLVTDWGLSGPAALKLSSYAARHLYERGFRSPLSVNWLSMNENEAEALVMDILSEAPSKLLSTADFLPSRLWAHIISRAGLRGDIRRAEMGSKGVRRLVAALTGDTYEISGKGRFRDEFVTAGGVDLQGINLSTMESKAHRGLYFAGEVLDVDAVTGGFNLQAAWATGAAAAASIAAELLAPPA